MLEEATIVELRGELDISSVETLTDVVRRSPPGLVVLDFSEVTFLDGAMISAVIRLRQNHVIVVRGLQGFPLKVVTMLGLEW